MEDTLIKMELVKTDIHVFKLPHSLVLLDGITSKDAVTITFKNGKLKSIEASLKGGNSLTTRNVWHINKAIIDIIETLEKEY